jgi:hypothetical protein
MMISRSVVIFATAAAAQVLIDTITPPVNSVGNSFLSHGWEIGQMVNYLTEMTEPKDRYGDKIMIEDIAISSNEHMWN